jgi:HD-GYP domain-containing protein (c-di-GMP phosphodiesterase class II)
VRDAILLLAQIVGIVDAYDALTSERPYRAAWSPERAFHELQEEASRGWCCGDLVNEFIRLGRGGGLARPAAE